MPGGNKRSHVLKQTYSFQMQVFLSTYELLLSPGIKEIMDLAFTYFCKNSSS